MKDFKEDIFLIEKKILSIQEEIRLLNQNIDNLKSYFNLEKIFINDSTIVQQNMAIDKEDSTDKLPFKPLKRGIIEYSTGNGGVPADRQTDTSFGNLNKKNGVFETELNVKATIDSLEHIQKELAFRFKQLTPQEILVFSAIYSFSEGDLPCDYKILSFKLKLTESSIRDYVSKLIKKGIPLNKTRLKNKQVVLSISSEFKKIVPIYSLFQSTNF